MQDLERFAIRVCSCCVCEWMLAAAITIPLFLASLICGKDHPIDRAPWDFTHYT
jgi:hypothetical protein